VLVERAIVDCAHRVVHERAALHDGEQLLGAQHDDRVDAFLAKLRVADELQGVAESLLVPEQEPFAASAGPRRRSESGAPAADRSDAEAGFVVFPAVAIIARGELQQALAPDDLGIVAVQGFGLSQPSP
jgi:hypothetical protein